MTPRRLRQDAAGVAATEFALVAPILLGLLLGSVEIAYYSEAIKKGAGVAHTAVDLITLEESFTDSSLRSTVESTLLMLAPLPSTNDLYGMRVTGVSWQKNPSNQVKPCEAWTRTYGALPVPKVDLAEMARISGEQGLTFVHVRFVYNYQSFLSTSFVQTAAIDEHAIAKPRLIRALSLNGTTYEAGCRFAN